MWLRLHDDDLAELLGTKIHNRWHLLFDSLLLRHNTSAPYHFGLTIPPSFLKNQPYTRQEIGRFFGTGFLISRAIDLLSFLIYLLYYDPPIPTTFDNRDWIMRRPRQQSLHIVERNPPLNQSHLGTQNRSTKILGGLFVWKNHCFLRLEARRRSFCWLGMHLGGLCRCFWYRSRRKMRMWWALML